MKPKAKPQQHYDTTALRREKVHFLAGVDVRELTESEARRACFAARIPVFFPTPGYLPKDKA